MSFGRAEVSRVFLPFLNHVSSQTTSHKLKRTKYQIFTFFHIKINLNFVDLKIECNYLVYSSSEIKKIIHAINTLFI